MEDRGKVLEFAVKDVLCTEKVNPLWSNPNKT